MKNKNFIYIACFVTVFFVAAWVYTCTYSGVKKNIKPDITDTLTESHNELPFIQLSNDAEYPAPIKKLQKALAVALQDNGIAASDLQPNVLQISESTSIKDIDELQEKLNNLKVLTGNN